MRPLLVYIHGFLSSPLSQKALEVKRYLDDSALDIEFIAPALPNYPAEAYRHLERLVEQRNGDIALIGSSMGGFMATALAEKFGLRAVLVNPSVKPYRHAAHFLGDNENPYTKERFHLHAGHIDELRELSVDVISRPELFMVLLQTGDELLNYQHAADYYQRCKQVIEEGGNHRFQNFDRHLPAIVEFLELA